MFYSGAEYSYYEATPKHQTSTTATGTSSKITNILSSIWGNSSSNGISNKASSVDTSVTLKFRAELISPASGKQIARAMPGLGFVIIAETPEMYTNIVQPYIDGIIQSGSLSWIQNIVQGKKELERLLVDADEWILNIDTKWRSHPDPFTVPKAEWRNHPATIDLYCLGIVKADSIRSLRDLRAEHIPMLQEMVSLGRKTIWQVYGVPGDQLRIFVHYQPQFYHFHVHFTRLENEIGAQCERGHLLHDIIQNLNIASDYYANRSICYKLNRKDRLYKFMMEKRSSDEKHDVVVEASQESIARTQKSSPRKKKARLSDV